MTTATPEDIALYGNKYYTPLNGVNTFGVSTFGMLLSENAAVISPTPAYAVYKVKDPNIVAVKDIEVTFVGVPRVGSSPLIVDFTATVLLQGKANSTVSVKEYQWYFDYDNNPSVYETSTIPTIAHTYSGYYGKKFSIKLIVILG